MKTLDGKYSILSDLKLSSGSHSSINDGACVMEMVSYFAGEAWSDNPECACPLLTGYAIMINDRFSDSDRQKLKPLIPMLVDTKASDSIQIARKRLMLWRNVTATYPYLLDLIKADKHAASLREFKNTEADMRKATTYLKKHRDDLVAIPNANVYGNAYINAYANADADVYAHADADADAYVNAHAYADAHAYANASGGSYVNACAYVYGCGKRVRSDIADICVETLRLAIEVGR